MYQNKGFFEKLLDISFSSFIAPQVVGALYVIGLFFAVLAALGVIFQGLAEGGPGGGLIALAVSIIGLLFYAIISRVSLESLVAAIRTAENTRILAEDVLARKTPGP
ncbi:MAG: DUF4282 domain-containing protein [Cyanobacteria bacterium J06621_11]